MKDHRQTLQAGESGLRISKPAIWDTWGRFLLGMLLAFGCLGGLSEAYLRWFPPGDLNPYLGDASPLTGPWVADKAFGATYRSWEAFAAANGSRLRQFGDLHHPTDNRPIWAFFGNSFVQAPGMLGDTARACVPERRIFHLQRNEDFFIRFAQIQMLLDHGFQPERIFMALMPLDVAGLGEQPLETLHVTSRGGLTYRPRLPAGLAGWLVQQSRLAFTAWCRSGSQHGDPRFRPSQLNVQLKESLRSDLDQLFSHLARATRQRQIPVTVILIPNYEQIMGKVSFAFQDSMTPLLQRHGYDVLDPRAVFCHVANRSALFLPDKHFSPQGNQLLLHALLDHGHGHDALVRSSTRVNEP